MQERVFKKPIRDLAELKQRLVKVWVDFEQTTVDRVTDQRRQEGLLLLTAQRAACEM